MTLTGIWAINWLRRGVVFAALAAAAPAWGAGADRAETCKVEGGTIVFEPRPLERRFVFRTIKVAPEAALVYEVSLAPCDRRECPLEMRLTDGETVFDRRVIVSVRAERPCVNPEDYLPGVGDPLLWTRKLTSWVVRGERFDPFVFSVTPVDLAPGLRGLFVNAKGERRKGEFCLFPVDLGPCPPDLIIRVEGDGPYGRVLDKFWLGHVLLVAVDKRFGREWDFSEISDYASIRVDVRDVDGDGFEEILYFQRRLSDDDIVKGMGGAIEATVFRWNNDTKKMEGLHLTEAGVPLYAHIVGVFRSRWEALKVKNEFCPRYYHVFSTVEFPQLEKNRFVMAKLSWRRELLEEVGGLCQPRGNGFVADLLYIRSVVNRRRGAR